MAPKIDAVRFLRAGRCPRKTDKGGLLCGFGGRARGGTHTREVRAGLEAWTARAELLRGGGEGAIGVSVWIARGADDRARLAGG